MKLSMLISKLMEQQDPNQSVSTLQSVLDLLSDEERKELATFIQQNLANISPEKVRQEKQAAATAAARAGMTPGTPRAKSAPPPSPQQIRQEKQAAAAAAARAGMTPAPARKPVQPEPSPEQTPSEPKFTPNFSQGGYGDATTNVSRGIPSVPRDPLAGLRAASKDSTPRATPDFSRSKYGSVKTNAPAGIPSVPKVPTAAKSEPKTTKKRSSSKKRNT